MISLPSAPRVGVWRIRCVPSVRRVWKERARSFLFCGGGRLPLPHGAHHDGYAFKSGARATALRGDSGNSGRARPKRRGDHRPGAGALSQPRVLLKGSAAGRRQKPAAPSSHNDGGMRHEKRSGSAIARGATASQTQKRIMIALAAAVVILAAVVIGVCVQVLPGRSQGQAGQGQQSEGFPYSINSNLVRDMRMLGPDVLLLTDEAVTVLDSSGREVSRMPHAYKRPRWICAQGG